MKFSPGLYETSTDYSKGMFQGVVVDNADPENGQRVRVRVDKMTDDEEAIPTDDLPWYSCMHPANSANNSTASVPQINSRVIVQFPDGNIYNGVVLYGISSIPAS